MRDTAVRIISGLALLGAMAFSTARAADSPQPPAFKAEGSAFRFDTGPLCGSLRSDGKSLGLSPVVDTSSTKVISGAYGIFSHYRLLDANSRYGGGAWDWTSKARLLEDGAVEVSWSADKNHPFDMTALYRWKSADTLDLTTTVTAQRELPRFEVFLASYFAGFPRCFAYARSAAQANGQGAFVEAVKSAGDWQMFPRDDRAVKIIQDGRWNRPPNPVQWTIRPAMAAPLAIRRDDSTGLAAVIMAPPEDCFALAMPYGEEGHRSLYLCLLGRDLPAAQSASAHARLVMGRDISDEKAVKLYEAYLAERKAHASIGRPHLTTSDPRPRMTQGKAFSRGES